MSDYTPTTNFTAKDGLISGNPLKVVRGTELDGEFAPIATAIQTKANTANPTFTGIVNLTDLTVSGTFIATVAGGTY